VNKFPAVCVHLLAKFVPWSTRKSNVVVIVEEVMDGGNGDLKLYYLIQYVICIVRCCFFCDGSHCLKICIVKRA